MVNDNAEIAAAAFLSTHVSVEVHSPLVHVQKPARPLYTSTHAAFDMVLRGNVNIDRQDTFVRLPTECAYASIKADTTPNGLRAIELTGR